MPLKWSLLLRSFSLLLTVVCDTMHFGKEPPFQRNFLSLSLASNPEGEVAGSFKSWYLSVELYNNTPHKTIIFEVTTVRPSNHFL